jgi:hypothetical protein
MIVKLNLQVQLSHPWSWLCMGSLARNSDKYCMTSGAYIHALLVWSTSAVLKGKLCPVGGRGLGDVRTYFSKHFLALYYKVGGGGDFLSTKGMFIYQYSNCSAWTVYNPDRVHERTVLQCFHTHLFIIKNQHFYDTLTESTFTFLFWYRNKKITFDVN